MAIILARPNDARARPSSLLRNEQGYELVFRSSVPLEAYAFCAELVRAIENFLVQKTRSRKTRNNLKFYVAFVAARLMVGKDKLNVKDIKAISESTASNKVLEAAYAFSRTKYLNLGGDDDVARGSVLVKRIGTGIRTLIKKNRKLKIGS
jgi:hypothetical protein